MDTKRLKNFITVVEIGNVRKAAEILNMSHPGLLKSIRSLEDEVGVELLVKDGRAIRETQAAKNLMVSFLAILEAEENLNRRININSSFEKIRVGSFEVFTTYFAPKIMESFPKDARFDFFECIPGELEEALISQKVDYGVTYLPIPKSGVDFFEITQIKMGIYGSKSFLETKFEDLPFIAPKDLISGTPTNVQGLDGWPDHKISRNIVHNVSLLETALSLARNGLGVVYIPDFVASLHNSYVLKKYELTRLNSPLKIERRPIYALKRSAEKESDGFKKFCRSLRSINNFD